MQQMAVNSHCLEHIMELSEQRDIVATEDIVDDRGIKLWAKGQKVSRSLQEKLLRHRLARPLETALMVDGGILADQVVTSCLELIEGDDLLQRISGSAGARSLLAGFRDTPLPGPFKLLLTSARDSGLATYGHSLICLTLCAGLAARLHLDDHSAQQLLLSALVHDIGELYVDPDYIRSSVRLSPSEWKQVAVHPRIGQLLIQELTSLPAAIYDAVAEHHERMDGSGYPGQRRGAELSRLGRLLAVADTAGAIGAGEKPDKAKRLAVALRIVPEEFDRAAVGAVVEALRLAAGDAEAVVATDGLQRIDRVAARLENAIQVCVTMAETAESRIVEETTSYVRAALHILAKALSATGAMEAAKLEEIATDQVAVAEICQVTREVEWRLRNLARNIHLRVHLMHDGCDLPLVAPLVDALDSTL